VLVIEAIGVRTGTLPTEAILPVLALGMSLGVFALCFGLYALVDIWRSGAEGLGPAVAGILYSAPVLVLLAMLVAAAVIYPPLNDVSTDLEDPPALPALDVAGGEPFAPESAALQVSAYPELTPAIYPMPIEQVYAAARTLVEDRGWSIINESPPPGLAARSGQPPAPQVESEPPGGKTTVLTQSRAEAAGAEPPELETARAPPAATGPATLEAVASTPLFGFADLVALRLTPTPEGTLLDMRSASQVGRHDLGQNARRIKAFLAELDAAVQLASEAPPPAPPPPPSEGAAGGEVPDEGVADESPREAVTSEEAPAGE
jgi:hypothetical protein